MGKDGHAIGWIYGAMQIGMVVDMYRMYGTVRRKYGAGAIGLWNL